MPAAVKRGHRAGFRDAFFQDLAVELFSVVEQHVVIMRLIFLTLARVNADLPNSRFQAKGAAFIRNDRDDQLSDRRIFQQVTQDADKAHRGRHSATFGAGSPLTEISKLRGLERRCRHTPLRYVTAELFAAFLQVDDLRTILRWAPRLRVLCRFFRHRNVELLNECGQAIIG